MSTLSRFLFFLVLCFLLFCTTSWGGGLFLYEQGTPDVGTANAGRAALAKDASTAAGNPAGMTRLDRSQLLTAIQPLLVRVKFDASSETTHSGGNGGDAGADRTGEASAIYQMIYMGKSREEALNMLTLKYYHDSTIFPAKSYFIKNVWQGQQWAYSTYDPCVQDYNYYDQNRYCDQ